MRSSNVDLAVLRFRHIAAALACLVVTGCAPYRLIEIASTNQSSRVDYLVIHFTSENYADSLRLLTEPSDNPVSAHYLIPESGDDTYDRPGPVIHRLVPEARRAWHAGNSYWGGEESLNDRSIGIELVNTSHCRSEDEDAVSLPPILESCVFHAFDERQIELLILLARDILNRYPGIDPIDIVGHADIAPGRKVDPGPAFPWKRLHDAGIGAWYDPAVVARYRQQFADAPPDADTIRRGLSHLGYRVLPCGGDDVELQRVLRAFQMHYLPQAVTLRADVETAATLFALLEAYRPEAMDQEQASGECTGGSAY